MHQRAFDDLYLRRDGTNVYASVSHSIMCSRKNCKERFEGGGGCVVLCDLAEGTRRRYDTWKRQKLWQLNTI